MIFGTDGIRGIVDKSINSKLVYNVGKAYAKYIDNHNLKKLVIVGKDTRTSGDTYFSAIAAGLSDYGVDVVYVGIVSTPMISFLVSKTVVGGGVMITASHNNYSYNGVKIFSNIGTKLGKTDEIEIDSYINSRLRPSKTKGTITFDNIMPTVYTDYLKSECKCNLENITLVVDCANGSNYNVAPHVFKSLGANVIKISCDNDGANINNNCGANHVENLKAEVLRHKADYGIAFDGDGDRLRLILKNGTILDGDDLLYVLAMYFKQRNKLNSLTVVGTIMSNMGLEQSLKKQGINLIRCDVGDKNVIGMLGKKRLIVGGEPSGHICLYEHNTTCDALFNCLYLLKIIVDNNVDISGLLKDLYKYPSTIKNIPIAQHVRTSWDKNENIKNQLKRLQIDNPNARIVVRPSGTEPMIRIYVEGPSEFENILLIQKIEKLILDIK